MLIFSVASRVTCLAGPAAGMTIGCSVATIVQHHEKLGRQVGGQSAEHRAQRFATASGGGHHNNVPAGGHITATAQPWPGYTSRELIKHAE
jgi:hypothetical protein